MKQKTVFQSQLAKSKAEQKNLYMEVREEFVKESVKEEERSKQKLEELISKAEHCLLKISTVFPFDLFPDTLTIDEHKVDLVFREFFASEVKHSVSIKDISTVRVETNPFLATIKIVINNPNQNENVLKIGPFKAKEAEQAKRVIQGIILCEKQRIEISQIEDKYLIEKLEELGATVG